MERARVRVAQLEAAVQLLDVEDPALPPLREALMKARALASADQIASSELYVAQKKKRLGRSGNVPIFNSSTCVDPKHRPSSRGRVAVEELTRERDL